MEVMPNEPVRTTTEERLRANVVAGDASAQTREGEMPADDKSEPAKRAGCTCGERDYHERRAGELLDLVDKLDLSAERLQSRAEAAEAMVERLAEKLEERSFDGGYDVAESCLECNRLDREGHATDCPVGLLLAEARRMKEMKP